MKIYKYHTINVNLLNSLRKKTNWYSKLRLLNDPYECFFVDNTNTDVYSNLNSKLCVCCFSKNMSEILMWSHYANNHKGVCLEFEEHKEEEIKGRLIEMQYENAVQIIDEVERYSSGDLSINIDTNGKFLKNKFKNWGYEEELRCYLFSEEINSSGEERPFFGELKSIYFGKNSSHEDIELVKHNTKHFDSLKYYKVDLNIKTMKMENIKEI
jgi:hypothetical protein